MYETSLHVQRRRRRRRRGDCNSSPYSPNSRAKKVFRRYNDAIECSQLNVSCNTVPYISVHINYQFNFINRNSVKIFRNILKPFEHTSFLILKENRLCNFSKTHEISS